MRCMIWRCAETITWVKVSYVYSGIVGHETSRHWISLTIYWVALQLLTYRIFQYLRHWMWTITVLLRSQRRRVAKHGHFPVWGSFQQLIILSNLDPSYPWARFGLHPHLRKVLDPLSLLIGQLDIREHAMPYRALSTAHVRFPNSSNAVWSSDRFRVWRNCCSLTIEFEEFPMRWIPIWFFK